MKGAVWWPIEGKEGEEEEESLGKVFWMAMINATQPLTETAGSPKYNH